MAADSGGFPDRRYACAQVHDSDRPALVVAIAQGADMHVAAAEPARQGACWRKLGFLEEGLVPDVHQERLAGVRNAWSCAMVYPCSQACRSDA